MDCEKQKVTLSGNETLKENTVCEMDTGGSEVLSDQPDIMASGNIKKEDHLDSEDRQKCQKKMQLSEDLIGTEEHARDQEATTPPPLPESQPPLAAGPQQPLPPDQQTSTIPIANRQSKSSISLTLKMPTTENTRGPISPSSDSPLISLPSSQLESPSSHSNVSSAELLLKSPKSSQHFSLSGDSAPCSPKVNELSKDQFSSSAKTHTSTLIFRTPPSSPKLPNQIDLQINMENATVEQQEKDISVIMSPTRKSDHNALSTSPNNSSTQLKSASRPNDLALKSVNSSDLHLSQISPSNTSPNSMNPNNQSLNSPNPNDQYVMIPSDQQLTPTTPGELDMSTSPASYTVSRSVPGIKTTMSKRRTESQSEVYEMETNVDDNMMSPGGNEYQMSDKIISKCKVKKTGSKYFERDAYRMTRVLPKDGQPAYEETDIVMRKDSVSATRGQQETETVETMLIKGGEKEPLVEAEEVMLGSDTDSSDCEDGEKEVEDEWNEEDMPEILEALEPVTVKDGSEAVLSCKVKAPQNAKIIWYQGFKVLKAGGDFDQSFSDGEALLRIAEVFPDDEGEYRCIVRSGGGEAETSTWLTVTEKVKSEAPEVTVGLCDQTARTRSKVILQCQFKGLPAPEIQWFHNKLFLRPSADWRQSFLGGVAKLTIADADTDDSGRYYCVASNAAGSVQTECTVTVRDASQLKGKAPSFHDKMFNVTAQEGEKVTFEVKVTGEPQPEITWQKDGILLPNCKDFPQTYDGRFARARLLDVCLTDAGRLTCIAQNTLGVESCSAMLTVKARLPTAPTLTFRKPLTDTSVTDGGKLVLMCETEDVDNSAVVSWQNKGQSIRPGPGVIQSFDGKVAKCELCQVNLRHSGTFECLVIGQNYEIRTSCIVTVKEKPLPVSRSSGPASQAAALNLQKFLSKLPREAAKINQNSKVCTPSSSSSSTSLAASMPDLDAKLASIEDEDVLHKMLTETEVFDERRLIRNRLRQIRENRTGNSSSSSTPKRMATTHESTEEAVFRSTKTEKGPDGGTTTTTTTTTKQTTEDGSTRITKQTKQVTQVGGLGSTNVKITKTEAGKGGPKNALAAFKEMDSSNAKPNPLKFLPLANIRRNATAIKQEILYFCQANTKEYENVNITNFSSSWNDGMAFCALVHHFYPRAFDYSKLNPKCRRGNFKLAFDVAEKLGGVAPLLDVDDMVRMKNPDWKCVFTYVQALYRHFREKDDNAAKKKEEEEEKKKEEEAKEENGSD